MDKRTLLYSISSLLCIVIVLILLRGQNNPDEEAKMLAYLEKKYEQDFDIGEVAFYDLGFGAGELIEAQATPIANGKLSFVITRKLGSSIYEDTYENKVVNTTLAEKLLPRVKEINEDAQFYVQSSYDGELNKRLTELSLNKVQPSVVVGIPVKTPFNKENYTERILTFINEMETQAFDHYTVKINFTDRDKSNAMDKYMKLSQKDLTQTEKEKQDFSEVKRQYEEAIMEKFTFNSNEVDFKNDSDFIQSLFNGTFVNK
jgi:RNase H-fold protein (predicted Holliday junction resolvase)